MILIFIAAYYFVSKYNKEEIDYEIHENEYRYGASSSGNYGSKDIIGKNNLIYQKNINRQEYIDYLNSAKWSSLKLERFAIDEGICKRCCKKIHISKSNCHHIHYDNFKDESIYDLVTLCIPCHEKVHKHHGKNAKQYPINF